MKARVVAIALVLGVLALVALTRLGGSAAAIATVQASPTQTITDGKGNCPSFPVNAAAFKEQGLNNAQVSFITNAANKAAASDRSKLRWALVTGELIVFVPLEGWGPRVILADQKYYAFDPNYQDKDAHHLVYILNQGPNSPCVVTPINAIGE